MPDITARHLSRRAVLAGACGGCAVALAGCAGYGPGRPAPAAPAPAPAGPAAPAPAAAAPDAAGAAPGALAAVADIPVGGGVVFADQDVVVTQPAPGRFEAFSATCTHQGCSVATVADGTINCPCHGSAFSIEDGSVAAGPASKPLPARKVTVAGTSITLA